MDDTNMNDIPCFPGLLDEINRMREEFGAEIRNLALRLLSILVPGVTLLTVALGRIS